MTSIEVKAFFSGMSSLGRTMVFNLLSFSQPWLYSIGTIVIQEIGAAIHSSKRYFGHP